MIKLILEDIKTETDGRDRLTKEDIVYELTKLRTEATEALSKVKEHDDYNEARSILVNLSNDSTIVLDMIREYVDQK